MAKANVVATPAIIAGETLAVKIEVQSTSWLFILLTVPVTICTVFLSTFSIPLASAEINICKSSITMKILLMLTLVP